MALLTREHMAREVSVSAFAVILVEFEKSEANPKMVRRAHGEGREWREVLQWPHLETVPHTGLFLLFVILRTFLRKFYKSNLTCTCKCLFDSRNCLSTSHGMPDNCKLSTTTQRAGQYKGLCSLLAPPCLFIGSCQIGKMLRKCKTIKKKSLQGQGSHLWDGIRI